MEEQAVWWRCALYTFLDSDLAQDYVEEDEARERGVKALSETVEGFLEGQHNFGTLKYRMDNTSVENGSLFPPRSVCAVLSDLALGVPVDDLEPALRNVARLPEGPGEAKGVLMDFSDLMEREVSRGHLKRGQAKEDRWVDLMACLWHIQDPVSWPLVNKEAQECLMTRGDIDPTDPVQRYAEYAAMIRRLADQTGAGMGTLEHLLAALGSGRLEVPEEGRCFESIMVRARSLDLQGQIDLALVMYERALSLRPRTPEALLRKSLLYESKGLIMAAIGELEALVEIAPSDVPAHRKLIALFKAQGMVREHNIEVRRFRAVMGK
jgi:tetratricopeptide (TPR) repeat protein